MGPAPNSGIDHTPGKEDLTENRIHEYQTSTTRCWTFKIRFKIPFKTRRNLRGFKLCLMKKKEAAQEHVEAKKGLVKKKKKKRYEGPYMNI